MIIYVLMLCSFAVATAEFVLVGLLPQIAADLAVPVPAVGQLVTVYMLIVTVGGPASAVLTRRLPRRGLLAATMALATLCAAGSALADSYAVLLTTRVGSALAQALFMAVASEMAMAAAPAHRQTAAVARVFGGFAVATVVGLPLGVLVGQAYGWHATFILVAVMAGVGMFGVLVFCPPLAGNSGDVRGSVRAVLNGSVVRALSITMLTLTGFVAVFTYVAPMLQTVAGFSPGRVSMALVGYGLGTIVGNLFAGRIPSTSITRALPAPVGVLAVILLAQGFLLRYPVLADAGLVLLGGATFVVVPLVQTWLMGQVGPQAAGLVAAVNISVAGVAGALGAALGGAVLAAGYGLVWINPVAAVPVLAATVMAFLLRRPQEPAPIGPAPLRAAAPDCESC